MTCLNLISDILSSRLYGKEPRFRLIANTAIDSLIKMSATPPPTSPPPPTPPPATTNTIDAIKSIPNWDKDVVYKTMVEILSGKYNSINTVELLTKVLVNCDQKSSGPESLEQYGAMVIANEIAGSTELMSLFGENDFIKFVAMKEPGKARNNLESAVEAARALGITPSLSKWLGISTKSLSNKIDFARRSIVDAAKKTAVPPATPATPTSTTASMTEADFEHTFASAIRSGEAEIQSEFRGIKFDSAKFDSVFRKFKAELKDVLLVKKKEVMDINALSAFVFNTYVAILLTIAGHKQKTIIKYTNKMSSVFMNWKTLLANSLSLLTLHTGYSHGISPENARTIYQNLYRYIVDQMRNSIVRYKKQNKISSPTPETQKMDDFFESIKGGILANPNALRQLAIAPELEHFAQARTMLDVVSKDDPVTAANKLAQRLGSTDFFLENFEYNATVDQDENIKTPKEMMSTEKKTPTPIKSPKQIKLSPETIKMASAILYILYKIANDLE